MSANNFIKEGLSLEDIFKPAGILAKRLPSYEYRRSQEIMAEAVLEAIHNRHALCVEAGTGTGKTLAYLIPALFSRQRVIVSTATKNLQDQLFFKDIPFIREHLFPDLAVTYMKGRQNYLCLNKFYDRESQREVLEETRKLRDRLSEWIEHTETGDRSELEWVGDDDVFWRHLDARSDTCTGQKCSHFADCYVTRMRQKAFESDLIVVNHALLFANLALESDEIGRVLPDFAVLILDEAHEIEDIAATHFGEQISNYQIEQFCRDFRKIFAETELFDQLATLEGHAEAFFSSFPGFENRYSLNFYRSSDGSIRDFRTEVFDLFDPLNASLLTLYHSIQGLTRRPADADPLVRRLEHMLATFEEIFNLDDAKKVYWCEKRGRGVFLHANPIDVAPILQEKLFSRTETTILTSATLATNNNLEYLKQRLGVPEPEELIVPGEFDYSKQSILYVPKRFPEPRSPGYLSRLLEETEKILDITEGHAFLLFTSFAQLDRVYEALKSRTAYPLFRQGDRPKNQLLEAFKAVPHAVLCATSSFWQGVDVQGDALRAVLIDKLPFLVPSEPLVAARINRLEAGGENSFLRYSVPEAIITLKQGLGRLIRSRQDRGILAIFDSRLRNRSYGKLFFESLPECPLTGEIDDLRRFFQEH